MLRLPGSQDAVGNVTFSRFYALHTVLLPTLTTILIGIHVYLARKHGVAAAVGEASDLLKARYEPEAVEWVRHGNRGRPKRWVAGFGKAKRLSGLRNFEFDSIARG
jgi:quinol-cytochrome oxidoreductase complex cytochrome b subunit